MTTLLLSNRLPVTLKRREGKLELAHSVGGLSSALSALVAEDETYRWIGWPGDILWHDETEQARIAAELAAQRLLPVYLNRKEIDHYYERFCNTVLWPVLHDRIDHIPATSHGFEMFRKVNERFAAIALQQPADRFWIHDFHLALTPQLLRAQRPQASIGFFLHVPFSAPEVFSVLPWREALLHGLLGADLVGFHTEEYRTSFLQTVARVLHFPIAGNGVQLPDGRFVRVEVHPLGVDHEFYGGEVASPVAQELAELRQAFPDTRVLLGVDRLDYTKGIPRRLLAFERLLERSPALAERVCFLQIVVPSRESVPAYAELNTRVEQLVGRINGKHTTLRGLVPLRYLTRSFSPQELIGLYRGTDVMVVTPLRDGMNLVAKEFVAARTDQQGVLVLSEFAGAAAELRTALQVNPYDVEGVAVALEQAIHMDRREQTQRMQQLRKSIREGSPTSWARMFLSQLSTPSTTRRVS